MNPVHALYPYALVAANTAIGWLSYTALDVEFGVLFVGIGLLVFIAVAGRTARRITRAAPLTLETVERRSTRR